MFRWYITWDDEYQTYVKCWTMPLHVRFDQSILSESFNIRSHIIHQKAVNRKRLPLIRPHMNGLGTYQFCFAHWSSLIESLKANFWGCSGFCFILRLQWFSDPDYHHYNTSSSLLLLKYTFQKENFGDISYITFYSFRDIRNCFKFVNPVNYVNSHANGE